MESDPKKIALNKLIINDVSNYSVLWDENHPHYYVRKVINDVCSALGSKYNMSGHNFWMKWRRLRLDYQNELTEHRLSFDDDEIPSTKNYRGNYPYFQEMKFLNRFVTHIKPIKSFIKYMNRRRLENANNSSKREEYRNVPLEQLGNRNSSQSVSLETRADSQHNTDNQDSSKLQDVQDSSKPVAQLGNVDKATETSSPSNLSQSSEDDSYFSVLKDLAIYFELLKPDQRYRLSVQIEDLIYDFEQSFSSSENSFGA